MKKSNEIKPVFGKYLPADNVDRSKRDLLIVDMSLKGKSMPVIADIVGLSTTRVFQILRTSGIKHNVSKMPRNTQRHDELVESEDEGIALRAVKLRYQVAGTLQPDGARVGDTNILMSDGSKLMIASAFGIKIKEYEPEQVEGEVVDAEAQVINPDGEKSDGNNDI